MSTISVVTDDGDDIYGHSERHLVQLRKVIVWFSAGLAGAMSFKTSIIFDSSFSEFHLDDVALDGNIEGIASIPTIL